MKVAVGTGELIGSACGAKLKEIEKFRDMF